MEEPQREPRQQTQDQKQLLDYEALGVCGRSQELGKLHQILQQTQERGQLHSVWIQGASGSGKSTLVQQFLHEISTPSDDDVVMRHPPQSQEETKEKNKVVVLMGKGKLEEEGQEVAAANAAVAATNCSFSMEPLLAIKNAVWEILLQLEEEMADGQQGASGIKHTWQQWVHEWMQEDDVYSYEYVSKSWQGFFATNSSSAVEATVPLPIFDMGGGSTDMFLGGGPLDPNAIPGLVGSEAAPAASPEQPLFDLGECLFAVEQVLLTEVGLPKLIAGLKALLQTLARRFTVVLALDDLQWVNAETLAIVRALLNLDNDAYTTNDRTLSSSSPTNTYKLMFIGSHRPIVEEHNEGVGQAVGRETHNTSNNHNNPNPEVALFLKHDAASLAHSHRMVLSGLDSRGVTQMLQELLLQTTTKHDRNENDKENVGGSGGDKEILEDADKNAAAESPKSVLPLVQLIYPKTLGNPFLVLQLLRIMESEGCFLAARHNNNDSTTVWDMPRISRVVGAFDDANVMRVLQQKLLAAPLEQRVVLTLAACLEESSRIDPGIISGIFSREGVVGTRTKVQDEPALRRQDLVSLLLGAITTTTSTSKSHDLLTTRHGVVRVLHQCQEAGLVQQSSSASFSLSSTDPQEGAFWFSHDCIREAAWSLLPCERGAREELHLLLGRTLRELLASQQQQPSLFLMNRDGNTQDRLLLLSVSQLNLAQDRLVDPRERLQLAGANYEAAAVAMKLSSFFPAAHLLRQGIRLLKSRPKESTDISKNDTESSSSSGSSASDRRLDDTKATGWRDHYRLMIRLSEGLARMEFCCGRLDACIDVANEVIRESKSFADRQMAYDVKNYALYNKADLDELETSVLEGLRDLGYPLPNCCLNLHLIADILRIKWQLRGRTDEDLLSLPPSQDANAANVMELYEKLVLLSTVAVTPRKRDYSTFVCTRGLLHSLQSGTSPVTALAFEAWGYVINTLLGDSQEAYRFGKLGLSIAERRHGQPKYYLEVIILFYWWHAHIREPFHDAIEPMSSAIKEAWDLGFFEVYLTHGPSYLEVYVCCEPDLRQFNRDMRKLWTSFKQNNHDSYQAYYAPMYQMVSNLLEDNHSNTNHHTAVLLEGDFVVDQLAAEKMWEGNANVVGSVHFYLARTILNYLFENFNDAAEMSRRIGYPSVPDPWVIYHQPFFEGLLSLALYQQTGGSVHRRKARRIVKKFETLANQGNPNVLHMLQLLYAETVACKASSSVSEVQAAFDKAIDAASAKGGDGGFMMTAALSAERAAAYFANRQTNDKESRILLLEHYVDLAIAGWDRWGARAKVQHLQQKYERSG